MVRAEIERTDVSGPRVLQRVLLIALFAGMTICARSPDAGAGWRSGFVAFAIAAGLLVFIEWRRGGILRRDVIVMAIALRVVAFPLTPTLSDDGYRYVWDGMIQAQEGINPYEFRPVDPELADFHEEPIYLRMNSSAYYSVYPPLSQLVFALGGLLYPLGWLASWYLIKLLMVGGELIGLFLLSRMVSSRELLLYAWHPLVVIETAGMAHTEALTIGLLIATVWAVRRSRETLAGAGVAAAGWVKLVPFVFAPFIIRRMGWKATAAGIFLACALAAPYASSFAIPHVRESLDLYVRSFEFNAGPYLALKGMGAGFGFGDVSKMLGPALQWLFLLSLPVVFVLDWKQGWRVETVLVIVLSSFFLCSTTLHPWYLLPLLALLPLIFERDVGRWYGLGWMVLGVVSLATYSRYAGPQWSYGLAIWLGWLLWSGFMVMALTMRVLPHIMRKRAMGKWDRIRKHLPMPIVPKSPVLDLGAGEGFVGHAVQQATGAQVMLVDVVDFNQTQLPLVVYDGRNLPYADGQFEFTVVSFVLHHSEDAERTLSEAIRVTNGPVAVLESVYVTPWQHWLLDQLDRLANALRSEGRMTAQEEHLRFRTNAQWLEVFAQLGLRVDHVSIKGKWIHQRALYVVQSRQD